MRRHFAAAAAVICLRRAHGQDPKSMPAIHNFDPYFRVCKENIGVFEDSEKVVFKDFFTEIDVNRVHRHTDPVQDPPSTPATWGGLESLYLFPDHKQNWKLDIEIIRQIPPLPTNPFSEAPYIKPNTGSCTAKCTSSEATPVCPTDCGRSADHTCTGRVPFAAGNPASTITNCVPLALCKIVQPPIPCTCRCECQKEADCDKNKADFGFTLKPDHSGIVEFEVTMTIEPEAVVPGGTYTTKRRFTLYIQETNDGPPSFNLSKDGRRVLRVYEDSCNIYSGFVRSHNVGNAWEEWAGEHLDYQFFPAGTERHPNSIFGDTYRRPGGSGDYGPGGQCGCLDPDTGCGLGTSVNPPKPCQPATAGYYPGPQPDKPPKPVDYSDTIGGGPPAGQGKGHRGIDASFPEGTLFFCMAQDVVDTAMVTMTCVDECNGATATRARGQEMHITTAPPGGVPPDGPQDPGAGTPLHDGFRDWACWDETNFPDPAYPLNDGNLPGSLTADASMPDPCQRTITGKEDPAQCEDCELGSAPSRAGLGNQHSKCPEAYFQVEIIPVNDPPGRCPSPGQLPGRNDIDTIAVPECSETRAGGTGGCAHSIEIYERNTGCCGPGGGIDEQAQKVDVDVISQQPGIYEEYPTFCFDTNTGCSPQGSLSFKLRTWASVLDNQDELVLVFNDDGGVDNRKCEQAGIGTSDDYSGNTPEAGGHCPFGQDKRYCTITVNIQEVNDPPVWELEPWNQNMTIEEDSGELFIKGFATHVNPGVDPNEASQYIAFNCTDNPRNSFAGEIEMSTPNGDLQLVTAPDANGLVTVTCSLCDRPPPGPQALCTTRSFTINIKPVNDCPSLNLTAARITATEGGSYRGKAALPYAGAFNEIGQAFTYDVQVHAKDANGALFGQQPTIDPNGELTFSCLEGKQGNTVVRVIVKDNGGGVAPHCDTGQAVDLTISCIPHNQPPSFEIPLPAVTVWQDTGAVERHRFATNIDKGHPLEGWQNLTFFVTGYDPAMFSRPPTLDPTTGTLDFVTAPGATGHTLASAVLEDNGGGDAPDKNRSQPLRFNITIRGEVAPTCDPGGVVHVDEDSGGYGAVWAIRCDPGGLRSYDLSASAACNSTGLFLRGPDFWKDNVSGGNLSFIPLGNRNGKTDAACAMCIRNNRPLETCYPLTIVVHPTNDPPTFRVTKTELTAVEDQENIVFYDLIAGASVGPPDEVRQGQWLKWTVRLQDATNPLLAKAPEVIDGRHLRLQLAPDMSGSAVLLINATDMSTVSRSKSTVRSVRLTVSGVNDPPSFSPGGNVTADADDGELSVSWATKITAGAPDEDLSQNLRFEVTPASPDTGRVLQAAPALAADGTLLVTPVPGVTGSADFRVVLHDDGSPPKQSAPHVLHVTLIKREPYRPVRWVREPSGEVTVTEDGPPARFVQWCAVAPPAWPYEVVPEARVMTEASRFAVPPAFRFGPRVTVNGTLLQYGELAFSTAPDRFGEPHIEVSVADSFGTQLLPVGILVRILAVNDPPGFAVTETLRVMHIPLAEAADWGVVRGWATAVTAGPFEDDSQHVEFAVTPSGDCFAGQVRVEPDGTLLLPLRSPPAPCSGSLSVWIEDIPGGSAARLRSGPEVAHIAVVDAAVDRVQTTLPFSRPQWALDRLAQDAAAQVSLAAANATALRLQLDRLAAGDAAGRAEVAAALAVADDALRQAATRSGLHAARAGAEAASASSELAALDQALLSADPGARGDLQRRREEAAARNATLGLAAAFAAASADSIPPPGTLADDNAFVAEFRSNLSAAFGVPPESVSVHSSGTATTADGTAGAVLTWSLAPLGGLTAATAAGAADTFFSGKDGRLAGVYTNSTRVPPPATPPPTPRPPARTPAPPSSSKAVSTGALIGILAGVSLATLVVVAGAVYVTMTVKRERRREGDPSERSRVLDQPPSPAAGQDATAPDLQFSDAAPGDTGGVCPPVIT